MQEKKGVWQFGYEKPIKTFKFIDQVAGLKIIKEKSVGFNSQFEYFYPPRLSKITKKIFNLFSENFKEKILTKLFGGYLLLTVFKKL